MHWQAWLAGVAIVIGFIGYGPYLRSMLSGKTTPHAFSWLVWGVLTAIAFVGQLVGKGGAGAWVTGVTAGVCFFVFCVALVKGTREFPLSDWVCLGAAVAALAVWAVTNDPVGAIVLITVTDMVAFVPTFRKSWHAPGSENAFTYSMSGAKFAVGIAALASFSVTTVLYPASLVLTNGAFVAVVLWRRRTNAQGVVERAGTS